MALPEDAQSLNGIVFHRAVRSTFAILLLATSNNTTTNNNDTKDPAAAIVLRIQFGTNLAAIKELRSWCRRFCKMGDEISIALDGTRWEEREGTSTAAAVADDSEHCWERRLVVDIDKIENAQTRLRLVNQRYWDMKQCQAWQQRFVYKENKQQQSTKKRPRNGTPGDTTAASDATSKYRHGGGLGKRTQGQQIANFVFHIMAYKLNLLNKEQKEDSSQWVHNKTPTKNSNKHYSQQLEVLAALNAGSGVVDAAGGSGHVSMALSILGVKSTVVDPRTNVGKLPAKDRKYYNRQLRLQQHCQPTNDANSTPPPALPQRFESLRAWFVEKPDGVDCSFRQPHCQNNDSEESVLICDTQHPLLASASLVVALHPDEITGSIVETCVKHRIPFLVVPCCVFSRLFPNRFVQSKQQQVTTYEELIEYLVGLDPQHIKKTALPFEGANIALWSSY